MMEEKYIINYGNGVTYEITGTLSQAMQEADEGAGYTQQGIYITNADHEPVAERAWHDYTYDSETEDCNDPIIFGDFGFYGDWIF